MNALHNTGLGDTRDPAVLAQLVAKHPKAKRPVPQELDQRAVGPGLHPLKMTEPFRKLHRMKAAGSAGAETNT